MMATQTASRPIRQLPLELANQIAAGEVVERPSSVVKELLENSLDAGATRIEVNISRGGLQEIIVRDNGAGIPQAELPLAISRHATSKISNLHDLENILSLGFRGEALASIGSVSRMQVLSCCNGAAQAWQIDCASDDLMVHATAHPAGTSIIVRDLFYNTPARRKFMRSETTEFRHIDEVVRRMALSHFHVGFSFRHNERIVYQFGPADTEIARNRRVAKLCGKAFMDQAVQIDFAAHGLRLWGWLSGPDFSRSQNDLQHFYVNGRIIRDRLVNHAIHQVYQTSLPPGRHGAYLLQLEIAPSAVDVNVHPTKHEVRFREARLVHDFIHRCLRDGLSGTSQTESVAQPPWTGRTQTPAYSRAEYTPAQVAEPSPAMDFPLGTARVLLHGRFVLAENAQGLVIVDAYRALQRIIFQKLSHALEIGEIPSRPLLIPKSISVSATQADQVERSQAILTRLGLDLSRNGPESVMLRMLPVSIAGADVECLIRRLLQKDPATEASDDLLQAMADVAAETQTLQDSPEDLQRLLREIESLNDSGLWRCFSTQELQTLLNPQHPDSVN